MQCVILAGGLGTRMWPQAQVVPKTMLPVAGRPFADWQLRWLKASGVTSVVYCVGYLGHQVQEYVGDGRRWGVDVTFVDEGEVLRGTAGALRLALDQQALAERFLVLYGDSLLQVDPRKVFASSERSGLPALMTVFENNGQWDTSNVVFGNDRVLRYEKGLSTIPTEMRWIDYGLSVLRREVVKASMPPDVVLDLAPVFGELARTNRLAGLLVSERFYEIGSPTGLIEAEAMLSGRQRA